MEPEAKCERAKIAGNWLFSFALRTGSCNQRSEILIELSESGGLLSNCSPDVTWSDDSCKMTIKATCQIGDGETGSSTIILTQSSSNPNTITGIETAYVQYKSSSCTASYDIVAKRQ